MMNMEEVKSWTAQKLVLEAWHEFNQKSAIALSYMHILLDENSYGFTNLEQEKALTDLQQELVIIRQMTEMMGEWISQNKA